VEEEFIHTPRWMEGPMQVAQQILEIHQGLCTAVFLETLL
jgi:hypothetical protein